MTKKKLNTEERFDRLERLVVRLLLSTPAGRNGSQLINVERLPRTTANALNKRFYPWAGEEDKAEAAYALDSILDMCASDIAAAQDNQDKADAKAKGIILDAKRAEAEDAKRIADEAARVAQEEIDALAAAQAE